MTPPKAESKVFTFRVLLRQLTALQAIQKHTGTAVAEQLRRGIDLWLKSQEQPR
jgi:hypothetical protein